MANRIDPAALDVEIEKFTQQAPLLGRTYVGKNCSVTTYAVTAEIPGLSNVKVKDINDHCKGVR